MVNKKDVKNEAEIFVPSPQKLELVSGEEFTVPRVNWRKQISISRHISKLIQELDAIKNIDFAKLTVNDVLNFLPELIEKAPDVVTEMCMVLTEKDKDWVETNMDLDSIVELLTPFFKSISKKLSGLVGKKEELSLGKVD